MSVFERSEKNSHLDTILYEIAMLDFCHSELTTRKGISEPEQNLFIEGFLLHFRNVVEFFSGKKHRPAKNGKPVDLSTADPAVWAGRNLTTAELAAIQAPAQALEDKYFVDVSQYLQHCTERRFAEFKQWKLTEMREELEPIVTAFNNSFPPQQARPAIATLLSPDATHTLSGQPRSMTLPGSPAFRGPGTLPEKQP